MTYQSSADTLTDLWLILALFGSIAAGVTAAVNHWPGYWIACVGLAGVFVYRLVTNWPKP